MVGDPRVAGVVVGIDDVHGLGNPQADMVWRLVWNASFSIFNGCLDGDMVCPMPENQWTGAVIPYSSCRTVGAGELTIHENPKTFIGFAQRDGTFVETGGHVVPQLERAPIPNHAVEAIGPGAGAIGGREDGGLPRRVVEVRRGEGGDFDGPLGKGGNAKEEGEKKGEEGLGVHGSHACGVWSCLRISLRLILPEMVLGSSGTKTTARGYL